MSDNIMLMIEDDGETTLYDDTYDITIHCVSKEEQDEVMRLLENEPHWIPCSERLPEKNGRYWVTLEDGYVTDLYYNIEKTECYPKGFYYLINDGRMAWLQTESPVLAWMPLPEPYDEVTE